MKIRVGARCNGMHIAAEEVYEVDDDISDDDLDEMAREHGYQVTGYEHWYEKIE